LVGGCDAANLLLEFSAGATADAALPMQPEGGNFSADRERMLKGDF